MSLTLHWTSLHDFVAMGGHAGTVWASVGAVAVFLVAELVLLGRRRRAALRALAEAVHEEPVR